MLLVGARETMRGVVVTRTFWIACDAPLCGRRVLQPVEVRSLPELVVYARDQGWFVPQRTAARHYCPLHSQRAKAQSPEF